jgi:hypothetical protein
MRVCEVLCGKVERHLALSDRLGFILCFFALFFWLGAMLPSFLFLFFLFLLSFLRVGVNHASWLLLGLSFFSPLFFFLNLFATAWACFFGLGTSLESDLGEKKKGERKTKQKYGRFFLFVLKFFICFSCFFYCFNHQSIVYFRLFALQKRIEQRDTTEHFLFRT